LRKNRSFARKYQIVKKKFSGQFVQDIRDLVIFQYLMAANRLPLTFNYQKIMSSQLLRTTIFSKNLMQQHEIMQSPDREKIFSFEHNKKESIRYNSQTHPPYTGTKP